MVYICQKIFNITGWKRKITGLIQIEKVWFMVEFILNHWIHSLKRKRQDDCQYLDGELFMRVFCPCNSNLGQLWLAYTEYMKRKMCTNWARDLFLWRVQQVQCLSKKDIPFQTPIPLKRHKSWPLGDVLERNISFLLISLV